MAFEVNFRNAVNVALIKYAFNNSNGRTGKMACEDLKHGVINMYAALVELQ